MDKTKNLLEVRNLTVHYETDEGICEAVNDISFDIHPGEILGVVGETGAGKTTIALSIMGLLPKPPAHVISGSIKIEGNEMLSENRRQRDFSILPVKSEKTGRKTSGKYLQNDSRQKGFHDVSGSDDCTEPGIICRRSDRRGDSDS